jgi:hypothetical protein
MFSCKCVRSQTALTGPAQRNCYIIKHLELHHVTSSKLWVLCTVLWIALRPLHTFDASLSRAGKKACKFPCIHRLASLHWCTERASTVESCISDTFCVKELSLSLSFDVTFLVLLPQKHYIIQQKTNSLYVFSSVYLSYERHLQNVVHVTEKWDFNGKREEQKSCVWILKSVKWTFFYELQECVKVI